jgi:hypothetical protein
MPFVVGCWASHREEVVDVGEGGERVTKVIGIDPFQYNTLASVCMATYRYLFLTEKNSIELEDGRTVTGYLQNDRLRLVDEMSGGDGNGETIDPDTVQIVKKFVSTPFARMPACGFGGLDTHSRSSIIWLQFEAKRHGVEIQQAQNGGEHRVRNPEGDGWFKLDGYHKDPTNGQESAWEFLGCVIHGCQSCYGHSENDDDSELHHPHTGESLHTLYRQTVKKLDYLRHVLKINVHIIWECEFQALLKSSMELQELEKESELLPRLDPRQAFKGGRTNATKLYRKASDGKKIGYVDICSLYPMVLKNDIFPVGIPEVIIDPRTTDISQYFGLVQAKVLPLCGLYHPCLPLTCNGKLMFPLCTK